MKTMIRLNALTAIQKVYYSVFKWNTFLRVLLLGVFLSVFTAPGVWAQSITCPSGLVVVENDSGQCSAAVDYDSLVVAVDANGNAVPWTTISGPASGDTVPVGDTLTVIVQMLIGEANDLFGYSVSIDGDYAIVGAYEKPINQTGSAYIFKRNGTSWILQQKITASDAQAGDIFGVSVSISSDYAIVGASGEDPSGTAGAGSAYIFKRSDAGWAQQQKINASDAQASDSFGISVSISGDYAIVGASGEDPSGTLNAGSAYIFKRNGTSWAQQQKINASDKEAKDYFGWSVSISGNYTIVGAPYEDLSSISNISTTDAGSAYIFNRSGTTWSQQQKINASDKQAHDNFGWSVSINGAYAIVGAPYEDPSSISNISTTDAGSAYIFKRSGTTWSQQQKINASDKGAGDYFGYSVSIDGDYAIVGAPYEDPSSISNISTLNAGSAYIFKRSDTAWAQQQKINASDKGANGLFGQSVSISGDYAVVGAPGEDPSNTLNAGSAYIFSRSDVGWAQQQKINASDMCSFDITVIDAEDPTISCLADQTVDNDADLCSYTMVGSGWDATFTDNCLEGRITNDLTNTNTLDGAVFAIGDITVTWTATDAAGLTDTCSFTVTVTDNQAPVISCPADQTVDNDADSCSYTMVGSGWDATFTDNCRGGTITNDFNNSNTLAGAVFAIGDITVTWTATDAAGLTDTCSFTVTVTDNQAPVISCPADQTVDNDADLCSYTMVGSGWDADFKDNCPGGTITNDFTNTSTLDGAVFTIGDITVTWTATDAAGLTDTCSFTVTVTDNQAPVTSCPADQAVDNDADLCSYTMVGSGWDATFTDNCPGGTITNDLTNTSTLAGAVFAIGDITVTWTATDAAGLTDTCSFTVTVTDNQAPVISCPADQAVDNDADLCSYTVVGSGWDADFKDNCPGGTITNDFTNTSTLTGAVFAIGDITVTWTATDAAGLTDTCSFTVTVTDNQAPVTSCPADQVVDNDADLCSYTVVGSGWDATFTDNCPGGTITNDFTNTSTLAGAVFAIGAITVTWTATDAAGLTDTCSFTVTVTDNQAPVISCPADQVVDNDADLCSYTMVGSGWDAAFTDNCPGGTITNDLTNTSTLAGAVFAIGDITVTWTATDAAGLTDTCSFTVTVTDNQAPVTSCPADQVVDNDADSCSYTMVGSGWDAAFTDNCPGGTITNDLTNTSTLDGAVFTISDTTVTWTATDAAGLTDTCSFTVTVTDNQAPVTSCPADQTVDNDADLCSYTMVGSGWDATFTDNCPGGTITNDLTNTSTLDGAVFAIGDITVTWTATDAVGNTDTCSFTVTVTDNQAPVTSCPADQTVDNDTDLCSYTVVGSGWDATLTDNCPGGTITNDLTNTNTLDGAVFAIGNITVTWTATDAAGNTDTCSFTVTVTDNQAPVISCPADQTVDNDTDSCSYTVVGSGWDATFTDNCPGGTITNDLTNTSTLDGAVFAIGNITVTWTATDAVGNTDTCSFTVTVTDNQAPVISCPADQTVDNDTDSCSYTVVGSGWDATLTDNCPGGTITNDLTNTSTLDGAVFAIGNITVTWTATDAVGNTDTCSFTVTVTDNQAPVISCPADQTVDNDTDSCSYTVVGSGWDATFTDNCPGGTITNDFTNTGTLDGAVFAIGNITVTWTATDAVGNTDTCSFTVTVTDNQAPVISCPADQTVDNDTDSCSYTVVGSGWDATLTDNCPGGTITNDLTNTSTLDGAVFAIGNITVTWTATDAVGNTDTCSFTVTVTDNQAPVISCPADQTVDNDADLCSYTMVGSGWDATFTDNCPEGTITNDLTNTSTLDGAVFAIGNITVTWTATDAVGNTDTCSFTVTVTDNQAPVISCPADQTVDNDTDSCSYTVVGSGWDATLTDNCPGGTITNDLTNTSTLDGAVFAIGNITVTWTATDAVGNTDTCSFTVTVTDNQAPVISCPADQTVDNDADLCSYTMVGSGWDATFTDNCPEGTITNDLTNTNTLDGAVFAIGNITVTWTATDAVGNTDTCSFTVTVTDNQAPVISCPADQTVDNDTDLCSYTMVGSGWDATFTDNCPEGTITNDLTNTNTLDGAVFAIGNITVTWTATDAVGNTDTCSFTVTVTDNQAPVISCPADQTVDNDADLCSYTMVGSGWDATFTDNCPEGTITNDLTNTSTLDGAVFAIGNITVTWTATDAAGNTDTCSFTVTVTDNQAPVISCPADQTVDNDANSCSYTMVGSGWDATFTDNCPEGTITNDLTNTSTLDGAVFAIGNITVTWTATDAAGNTDTCSFTVTVTDNQAPVISCPADQTVDNDTDSCSYTMVGSGWDADFTDNCPEGTITNDFNNSNTLDGAVFAIGNITVTWTATDAAGNTDTCSFTVTVTDNQAPVISCPADQTVDNDTDSCSYTVVGSGWDATLTDNCPEGTITNDLTNTNTLDGAVFAIGNITVTWTATDAAGNTDTCSFTVTVTDNQAPVISCPADQTVDNDANSCSYTMVGSGWDATFTDNCPEGTITNDLTNTSTLDGAVFAIGNITVTWTATDAAGNTDTCSFTVTVTDNQAPVISCPADQTVDNDTDSCSYTMVGSGWDADFTDNCPGGTITNDLTNTSTLAGAVFAIGDTPVTWTATDAAGLTDTCSFTVTVTDNQAPVTSCPADQVVGNDADSCSYTMVGSGWDADFTDNCPGGTITNDFNNSNTLAGAVFAIGDTPVTWTATDAAGLTDTCSFTVTVTDNQAPVTSCPADQTVGNDADSCSYTMAGSGWDADFTDNCPGGTITNDFNNSNTLAGAVFAIGDTPVTWTATDAAGLTDTCSFTVTVTDNQAPVTSCPADQTVDNDADSCSYTMAGSGWDADFTDNCPGGTITNDFTNTGTLAGAVFAIGDTPVTWTATDAAGLTDTCSFTVTVTDNQAPVTSCPADQTVDNDADSCSYTMAGSGWDADFTDNCPGGTITNDFTNTGTLAGAVFAIGDTPVTWTATDAAGLTDTCSFTVTVTDNQAPVISCPADQAVGNDADSCSYTMVGSGWDADFTDNCPGGTITNDLTNTGTLAGAVFAIGDTPVTWTATDAAGLTDTCSFTVTVTDNQAPVTSCPADQTVGNDADSCSYTMVGSGWDADFTDNCPGGTITNDLTNTGTLAGAVFAIGDTPVTWTATDAAGLTDTCSFTVTVTDNQAPVTSCLADQTVDNDADSCSYTMAGSGWDATFTDNCPGGTITNDLTNTGTLDGAVFAIGNITVTWTATDAAGLTDTCSFTVTVTDNQAPVTSCPADQTVGNDADSCSYTMVGSGWDATFTDNCPEGTITNDLTNTSTLAGAVFAIGNITVTWTATDAAGLTDTCSFTVTVTDNQAPVISCPADQTVDNDADLCSYTVVGSGWDATFTDNCPGGTITNDFNNSNTLAGAVFTISDTTVTWTATDAVGNTDTCSFTVTVTDNQAPVISCPADQTVDNDADPCSYTVVGSGWDATFTDNCPEGTITNDLTNTSTLAGAVFTIGAITVTWTATDAAGLTDTCSFTVTVTDNQAPVTSCPADQVVDNDADSCSYTMVGSGWDATFTDNCPGGTITNDFTNTSTLAGAVFAIGAITVTWTATDAAGLTDTCSFTVTVTDNGEPVISCPSELIVVENDPGQCNAAVNYGSLVVAADCDGNTVPWTTISGPVSGDTVPVGDTLTVIVQMLLGDASDYFGRSVSISGDYAIVGAYLEDPSGTTNAGSAYIFKRSGTTWAQQQKITASDKQAYDYFGYSVSISGDYAIVGARGEDPSGTTNAGSAYIFKRSGTAWTQQQKITASDKQAYDRFGYSVSISGDYAIVGAYYEDPSGTADAGSVYIFKRNGTTWSQQQKITASDKQADDYFGWSVSISGDYAIVGARGEDPSNTTGAGSAYIFKRSGTSWAQQQKITASDKQAHDYFGWSVSIDGDYAIVGAYYEDPSGTTNAGSAYIFKRSGTTWTQQQKINASDKQANDNFGRSVSISGDYAIVGASGEDPSGTADAGSAYIFKRNGTTWPQQQKINASDKQAYDWFGTSVSISSDYAIVGAYREDPSGTTNAGSAYIFKRSGTTWPQQQKINASNTCSFDITVIDAEDPTIICPADTTVNTDAGSCSYTVVGSGWDATLTDNCLGSTITNDFTNTSTLAGAVFAIGNITVTWTATDAVGNTDTCSFTVTVNGNPCPGSANNHNVYNNISVAVYPNPGVGYYTIEIASPESEERIMMRVYDVSGKLITQKVIDVVSGRYTDTMDLTSCQNGVYFIQLKGVWINKHLKVIKQ